MIDLVANGFRQASDFAIGAVRKPGFKLQVRS
jgi:hypothetical protein